MKSLLLMISLMLSFSAFSKGGDEVATERCQDSRAKLAMAMAEDIDSELKNEISYHLWMFWPEEYRLRPKEIVRTSIYELEDRVGIYYKGNLSTRELEFYVVYPMLKVEFLGEKIKKGTPTCVWRVRSMDFTKIRMVAPDKSVGNVEFLSNRKFYIEQD